MIAYRKAAAQDFSILAQMRVDMLCEDTDHPEEFRKKLRDNTLRYMQAGLCEESFVIWVAEEDGRIIAMGGAAFFALPPNDWCPEGKTAYIGNLYTVPECRGQGIGTRLFSLIVEEAKARGCERILLNATDMGRPIYEKCGFGDSPTAMAYYPKR
jgi:GNAT superfamily N-acetyltransferase